MIKNKDHGLKRRDSILKKLSVGHDVNSELLLESAQPLGA